MDSKKITNRDLKIFGIIWGIIFSAIGYHSSAFIEIFAFLAIVFFLTALFYPRIYLQTKIYQNWVKFGNVLGKVNGFLISFILFYGVFVPTGVILKVLRKDLLNKKLDKAANSYFIDRKEQPGDMKNQF